MQAGQPRECSRSQECSNHSLIWHWPILLLHTTLTMWLTQWRKEERASRLVRHAILVVDASTQNTLASYLATQALALPHGMVATWTLDLCSSRTQPAYCPVPSVWPKLACHSAVMPSSHHNHQLALQLRERVNKCECRLAEIFYL